MPANRSRKILVVGATGGSGRAAADALGHDTAGSVSG